MGTETMRVIAENSAFRNHVADIGEPIFTIGVRNYHPVSGK